MPHAKKLQGWVTIRGPDSGVVVQDEDDWLDLWNYDDVVIWCQFTEASNLDTFTIQTSPVRDGDMFVNMASLALVVTSTPRITIATFASSTTPLARYVRWRCGGRTGGTFSFTFRAWIVGSGRGLYEGDEIDEWMREDEPETHVSWLSEDSDGDKPELPIEENDEQARAGGRPPVFLGGSGVADIDLPDLRRVIRLRKEALLVRKAWRG
jgi:hypothetical protein